ncbi:hypothetical protein Q9966_016497 [Columba livia]|nr:hypothetical protein Q9966_016497 [Columba livia]
MAAAEGSALTGVAWSAAPDAAPAGWTVITGTVEGTPANLGKGFGNKGGGFLCVSTGGAQASPGSVVTDVQVLSDRTPHPPRLHPRPRVPGVPSRRLPEKTGVREAAAGGRGRDGCDRAEGDREEQDPARVPQNRGNGRFCHLVQEGAVFAARGAPRPPPHGPPTPPQRPPPAPAPPAPPQQVSNEHQTRISLRRLRHLRPLGDGRRPLRPAPQIRSQAQLRHQRSRRRSKRQIARRHRQRVQLHVRGGKDGGRSAPARRLLAPTPRG